MKTRVDIVGAGFSGLSLAHILSRKGYEVHVYEKSSRVGGMIYTHRTEHGLAENAANSIIATDKVIEFLKQIDASTVSSLKDSKKRYFYRKKITRWPLHIGETLLFIFKIIKIAFNKNAAIPKNNTTLQQWGQKHLGTAANDFLLQPAFQGIYAGKHEELSSKLILSKMFQKGGKYKGIISGLNGMFDIIEKSYEACLRQNVQFHFNSDYILTKENPLLRHPTIIATSSQAAAEVLRYHPSQIAYLLEQINLRSLISATLFFNTKDEHKPGFGVLIPSLFAFATSGILKNYFIFPNRQKKYSETFILNASEHANLLNMTDTEILQHILRERSLLLNKKYSQKDIEHFHIQRWPKALAHYDLKLEKTLELLKEIELENIWLHGNYLGGIGLSKILERSHEIAHAIELQFAANSLINDSNTKEQLQSLHT